MDDAKAIINNVNDQIIANLIVNIAELCYELYNSYYETLYANNTSYNYISVKWDNLPYANKKIMMTNVVHCMRYPETTLESLHDIWLNGMITSGWVYGKTRCEDIKTDPYIVPYANLPYERQAIYNVIKSICNYFYEAHMSIKTYFKEESYTNIKHK